MNLDFEIQDENFIQTLIDNKKLLGKQLAISLNSTIVGNVAQFTVAGTISEGDPVFLRGDEKIESGFGKIAQYNTSISPTLIQSISIASDKIAIVYEDLSNSNYLTAVIATLNSSSTQLTFGTPVVVVSQNPSRFSLAWTGTRLVIEYAYGTQGDCIIGSISGNTLTLGSPVTYYALATTYGTVAYDANKNKIIIFYSDNANSDAYRIGTVSGVTVSFDAAANLSIGAISTNYGPAIYSPADQRILVSLNSTQLISVQIITTTAIKGPVATTTGVSDFVISNNNIVGLNSSGGVRVYAINPSFNTITVSSETTTLTSGQLAANDDALFVIDGNSITTGTIGASNVITFNTAQSYRTLASSQEDFTLVGSVLITAFRSDQNNLGYFIMNPHIPYVPFRYVGLSTNDYTDGDLGTINFFSVNTHQTGLTPGLKYYIGSTVLTIDETEIQVGKSISSTSILIT